MTRTPGTVCADVSTADSARNPAGLVAGDDAGRSSSKMLGFDPAPPNSAPNAWFAV